MVNKKIFLILEIVLMLSVVSAWSVKITSPLNQNYNYSIEELKMSIKGVNSNNISNVGYSLDGGNTIK